MNCKFSLDLENKILVLDGATGTAIQNYLLEEKDFRGERFKEHSVNLKGCNELLNFTKPEIIEEIHRKYIEAGADIIETNSFNCNTLSLQDYKIADLSYDISKESALIAKRVANEYSKKLNKNIYVAGSIGPTSKSCCIPSGEIPHEREIDFDTLKEVYKIQINGLIDGGIDIVLIETVFDGLNAKAALLATEEIYAEKNIVLPVMISLTVDKKGKLISGQSAQSVITALDRDIIVSYGFNCSFGAKDLIPVVKKLEEFTSKKISLYPNAGLPNEKGEYDESPESMLEHLKELIDNEKINILGGCCGTRYSHIKAIADYVKNKKPRSLKKDEKNLSDKAFLSGNEIVNRYDANHKKRFIIVGERNNVAGSKIFKKLIEEKNYVRAMEIARNQIEAGAEIIDINLDDSFLESKEEMKKFLRVLQNDPVASKVAYMVDSSDFDVIEEGLKNISGKAIVNSLSLKEGEEEFLRKAKIIKKYGAALVVMAFDEKGQGVTSNRKIEICVRAKELLSKIEFKDSDIVFDPNILTIGTGSEDDKYNGISYIEAVDYLMNKYPNCGVTGGLSNVSFSFRGNNLLRAAIHSVFLELASEKGMNLAISNPQEDKVELSLKERELIENLILGKDNALDEIFNISFIKKEKKQEKIDTTPVERVEKALINGGSTTFEEDIKSILTTHSPLDIIQNVLMNGMEKVGKLFEKGELYLPQIIRSASVMEKAVGILLPLIETGEVKTTRGKIIMATVEGDVHDIGKNIVGTVLKCNGFEVIDLGVMASCELIVSKTKEIKPDIVTLSGLITPSLKEMEKVLKTFKNEGLDIPVLIAGAATSKLHTAVKLEPNHPGLTFYVTDASGTIPVVSSICSQNKNLYLIEKTQELKELREIYLNREKEEYKGEIFNASTLRKNNIEIPKKLGKNYIEISFSELRSLINWDMLLHALKVKNTNAENITLEDAKKVYSELEKRNYVAKASFGIFKCKKENDTIIIQDEKEYKIHMNRGEYKNTTLSLSDFIEKEDYIGAFVLSVSGDKIANDDKYFKILEQILETRAAEAASSYLQKYVNENIWKTNLRPAIGYSILADHSIKKEIFQLVEASKTGAVLTNTFAMIPQGSVCGLYISNEKSFYFDLKN